MNPTPSFSGSAGPADGDAVHPQGGLADAHRHALAVLAAGADAWVELEIVTYHPDPVEVGRAVADQHGSLQRLRQLAVLDLVGLGDLEHVLARRNVDLAAAEVDGVNPFSDRGNDLLRVALASEHVGVGHARHGHMGIALAPTVTGWLHAHETRVLTVLHIADQDAILDQHGAIAGRALVVDRKGAAPLCDRAVVDHGHALGGNPLPHQAGEGRGFLAVEITF